MAGQSPLRSYVSRRHAEPPASPSRRDLLRGGAAAFALGALQVRLPAPAGAQETASPTADLCLMTPELTEGPYYLDTDLLRQDITEGTPGLPLRLQVLVADSQACTPLTNAAVDIWHCDAQGFYSGVNARPGGGSGDAAVIDSDTFLRGIQLTGDDGVAEFTTIYPGWYTGRTVHIHMKVHIDGDVVDENTYDGGHVSHTGQLFFDDAISDEVYRSVEAYAGRDDSQRTRNDQDNILGDHLDEPGFLVSLSPLDESDPRQGYLGVITIGVDPNATPQEAGFGGQPPAGGPPPDGRPPDGPPPAA
ncbi:MAG: intradiol ring-cleavage dioxygenase [Thermomicrobiales bacterium]|nr:intradiol ring-cleavage dioxygenase [Thermomicrobiales bacterium]